MFILINENNSLTYYTSALEFEVESYLNKKGQFARKKSSFLRFKREDNNFKILTLVDRRSGSQQRYLHAGIYA